MSVYSVNVHPTSVTLTKGQWCYSVSAEVLASSNCCKDVLWYSDNPCIATVNQSSGYIYAASVGTTRIYAVSKVDSTKKDYCTVTVEPPIAVTGISVCPANLTMSVGETEHLDATVYPLNATNKTVTWSSDNRSVVTVDVFTGRVTAISAGAANITVTTNDGCFASNCIVFVDFPNLFKELITNNTLLISDIKNTVDGFYMATESLSTVLTRNGIDYLSKNVDNDEVTNVTAFYDDWYLYAVKNNSTVTYGLCKMREQEDDYVEGSSDFDDPGVTISFISLDETILLKCISSVTKQNTYDLLLALDAVTGPGVYEHNSNIVEYFAKVKSEGAYLVAEEYVSLIAQKCPGKTLPVPKKFISILDKINAIDEQLKNVWLDNYSRLVLMNKKNDLMRIPNWLVQNNANAGYDVYNTESQTINIADKSNLSIYEKYAILSTHTADVNFNSFAAEVEFHAEAVNDGKSDIPLVGKEWYEAAIRADMAIGEEYESGAYDEYYDLDSDLVKAQAEQHGEY